MSKRKRVLNDIKRSLAVMLVLVLTFSGYFLMSADGAETLQIVDNGKMIGVGYDNGNVFNSFESVLIENSGSVDMMDNPVLDMTVYITIDGVDYEVIKYSSETAYYPWGADMEDYGNGIYEAWMTPVYYDENGDEVDDIYPYYGEYRCVMSSDDSPFWGFSEDFINALEEQGIIDKSNIDWSDVISYITSADMEKKCTVEYILTDASGESAECIQEGISFYNYSVEQLADLYVYGKKVGYNRIESLKDLHESDAFKHIKMYEGNMYVDANNLDTLNGVLSFPNNNNSQLYHMSALLVNDQVVYNDGKVSFNSVEGYNILEGVLPNPVVDEETAIEEFLNIMCGKMYYSDDFATYDDYYTYEQSMGEVNPYQGHYIKYNNVQYNINAYNEYEFITDDWYEPYDASVSKEVTGLFTDVYDDPDYLYESFVLYSSELPEIHFDELDNVEVMDYYYWVEAMSYAFYDDYECEPIYKLMAGDEVVAELCFTSAMSALSTVAWYKEYGINQGQTGADNYFIDIWCCDDRELSLHGVTDMIPIETELVSEMGYEVMIGDLSYYFNFTDEEFIECMEKVGIGSESVKGKYYERTYIEYNPNVEEYKAAFVQAIKDEFGEEVYNAFEEYILDEYISYGFEYRLEKGNDEQKNTLIDVYSDELNIPLEAFDTSLLGEEYQLTQMWHLGLEDNFYYPVEEYWNESEDILWHGQNISIGYGHEYHGTPLNTIHKLDYETLCEMNLGTVVFAKVPDAIETQKIFTTEDTCEISWEAPNDNGAEILGYQIAIVPRNASRPTDDQYITVGSNAGSYTDIGDNYTINWTTNQTSYVVETNGESVDVYVRAVNVIGVAKEEVISIINPEDGIVISGDDKIEAGQTIDYTVLNLADINVETDCTFALQNATDGITISIDGKLTVSEDCTATNVTIVAIGKTGSVYEGKTASKDISVVSDDEQRLPDVLPDDDIEDIPDNTPDNTPDNVVDPDTGNAINYAVVTLLIAGAVIAVISRKKVNE